MGKRKQMTAQLNYCQYDEKNVQTQTIYITLLVCHIKFMIRDFIFCQINLILFIEVFNALTTLTPKWTYLFNIILNIKLCSGAHSDGQRKAHACSCPCYTVPTLCFVLSCAVPNFFCLGLARHNTCVVPCHT